MTRRIALVLASLLLGAPALATTAPKTTKARIAPVRLAPKTLTGRRASSHAPSVAFADADDPGGLHAARDAVGRRQTPASPAEDAAQQIGKLLRGPLRAGATGIFVADARTGAPLFAVNADDAFNPASNVKMISTAAALELLGPGYHYSTRVLGPRPDADGAIRSDIYLLGTYDPTLTAKDLDDLAVQLVARGVRALSGDLVIGADPTRDGIYHASVPIEITAGEPGEPPTVIAPPGVDLVTLDVTATTSKRASDAGKLHLRYQARTGHDDAGHVRIALSVSGTLGRGAHATYAMPTEERTATAAYELRGALRAHGIAVTGEVKVAELGDYVANSLAAAMLPDELARHDSKSLAAIVSTVNKYSINWLADRVIMTAAGLTEHAPPSMPLALDAMYAWLDRHAHLEKRDVVVDTGSGLSYKTQVSPKELVAIVRAAAGYVPGSDQALAHAWIDSLSIAGTDGTLARRFKTSAARGRIHGKTGTLSSSIALSGVLDLDPTRPLAFSIVTNGNSVAARSVRAAHEQVIAVLCKYIARTAKAPVPELAPPPAAAPAPAVVPDDETEPAIETP